MPGEFDYIAWLRARTPPDSRVLAGPGDDCAILAPSSRPQLITTDMLMDGTDFVVAEVGPRRAGRKAMNANLSDIAAMAGTPVAAVAAVALPRSGGLGFAEELYLGLRDAERIDYYGQRQPDRTIYRIHGSRGSLQRRGPGGALRERLNGAERQGGRPAAG